MAVPFSSARSSLAWLTQLCEVSFVSPSASRCKFVSIRTFASTLYRLLYVISSHKKLCLLSFGTHHKSQDISASACFDFDHSFFSFVAPFNIPCKDLTWSCNINDVTFFKKNFLFEYQLFFSPQWPTGSEWQNFSALLKKKLNWTLDLLTIYLLYIHLWSTKILILNTWIITQQSVMLTFDSC